MAIRMSRAREPVEQSDALAPSGADDAQHPCHEQGARHAGRTVAVLPNAHGESDCSFLFVVGGDNALEIDEVPKRRPEPKHASAERSGLAGRRVRRGPCERSPLFHGWRFATFGWTSTSVT